MQPPITKGEAVTWRDTLRGEIRAGTFVDPTSTPPPSVATEPTTTDTRLTFGDVADRYLSEYVRKPTRRPAALKNMEYQIAVLRRTEIPAAHGKTIALGVKPMADITPDDVEAVRTSRRAHFKTLSQRLEEEKAKAAAANASFIPDADLKKVRRSGVKLGEVANNRNLARSQVSERRLKRAARWEK